MHQAGAAALTKLLQYDPPDEDQRTIPCPCGHAAQYQELRSKTILSVLGPVELNRPYYLCKHCSKGQCPVDRELGIAKLESSPGVRRMEAVVGSEMPFASGCEPMKVLAGLDIPAKAIERAGYPPGFGGRDHKSRLKRRLRPGLAAARNSSTSPRVMIT